MPDFGKDIQKQLITYIGNQQSPIGRLFGQVLNQYQYQTDQAGGISDQLLGGPGYGRSDPNASPFYGGAVDDYGNPYTSQYGGNPVNPYTGQSFDPRRGEQFADVTGGSSSKAAPNPFADVTGGSSSKAVSNPFSDVTGGSSSKQVYYPDAGGGGDSPPAGGGGGGQPSGSPGPGYNISGYRHPSGGIQGGLIGRLNEPTSYDDDFETMDMYSNWAADAGGWNPFVEADLRNKWKEAGETGLYSQADDSASKNWAQLFRNRGATEEEANAMAADLAANPNKYESTLAKFATGPGKYDDMLGTAYGGLLTKPGFSSEEKTALEQQGMLSAKSAADALKSAAMRRAATTGNAGSTNAALASIGRDTTRGIGEQARQNILAEAAQRRADIAQGGEGVQKLQSTIDARMGALEGVNAAENARRLGAMGAKTQLSGQEIGRMTDAAKAASDRAQNLAQRKFQGLAGAGAQEQAVAGGRQAALGAKANYQNQLYARRAAQTAQQQALYENERQRQFGGIGGQGQIAGLQTEGYGVGTSAGGGI